MLLVGRCPESTASQRVAAYVGVVVLITLMMPWLLISAGCIVVGCLAIPGGETGLMICLPAGLTLLIGPAALIYLQRRWYPSISGFTFDGITLQFKFRQNGDLQSRAVTDVLTICKAKKPRRPVRGYYVTFRDRQSIFIPRFLTNADELYETLRGSLAAT